MKYIFVEGLDDYNFINEIIKETYNLKIIQYSCAKKQKINNLIKTIDKMKEEYILLADLDEKDKEVRKTELKRIYKNLDCDKIYFSIQEIEAWYLSGISEDYKRKYKINNRVLLNTQDITKEKFEKLFENTRDTIYQIKLNILSEFDTESAKERNSSLKLFLENMV